MLAPARLPPPVRPGDSLRPGDRVGVAALSGPVAAERLEAGLAALAALGFEPVPAANLASRHGYLAGSDDERLAAFHELAADPSLTAIFFARGGYGVPRILERIDWDLLAAHPRAYVGYSDLTPFLQQVLRRLGLAAFHGPMAAADLARGLSPEEERSLLSALAGELPLAYPAAEALVPGIAEGPLAGGCLSLLAAAAGTPFAPDLEGGIVLLEDVNERLYRIDRMLTQLLQAGLLGGVAGIALGRFDLAAGEDGGALPELFRDRLGGLGVPVALGFPSGHSAPNWTFPLGLTSRLDAGSALTVAGSALSVDVS